jgi:DNA-binding NarL/FixJ family response regulator
MSGEIELWPPGEVLSIHVQMPGVDRVRPHLSSGAAEGAQPAVLLADRDPVSRQVVGAALSEAGELSFVGCVDASAPVQAWPRLEHADVVVLSASGQEDPSGTIQALVSRGVRVLVLAARWSAYLLSRAIAAGAAACLAKSTEGSRIAVAAHAVASGYLLLSPELVDDIYHTAGDDADPRATADKPPELPITKREYEVLTLLAKGMSTTEVARSLGVSATTVKSHVSHALPKLGVRNRQEAIRRIEAGSYVT